MSVFVVHVGDQNLDPGPFLFVDSAEIFVQKRLLPRAYDVDGFRFVEIDEVAAVFGIGGAEPELVDEEYFGERLPVDLRIGLVKNADDLRARNAVGGGDPLEGVAPVQFGDHGGALQVRQRSPSHRPLQWQSECLFAFVARIPDPVADEDFGFQDVRAEPDFGGVSVVDDAGG